ADGVASPECDVYMIHQGDEASRRAASIAETLRDAGLRVIVHAGSAGFKSQFKRADASGAQAAVILGADELATDSASIKWLRFDAVDQQSQQQTVPLVRLITELKLKV